MDASLVPDFPGAEFRQPAQRDWRLTIRRKLRLTRGPLRWWLLLAGLALASVTLERFWVGSALVAVGTILHFLSKGYLHQDSSLTVAGPYRFSRNPFYLGNLVAEAGLLVIIGSWLVAGVYLAAWAYVYWRQISLEQQRLDAIFGEAYRRYCQRVPALIPLPWKFLPANEVSGVGFSWRNRNLLGGREVQRAVRLLAYPSLLLAAAELRTVGWTVTAVAAVVCFAAIYSLSLVVQRWIVKLAARHAVQDHRALELELDSSTDGYRKAG